MTDLLVRIETRDEWSKRAVQAMRAAQEGRLRPTQHSISFPTYADMHDTLSPGRLEIIKALAGQNVLTVHQVARLVGRDIEAVRYDVTRLINSGVIDRDGEGVRFDYDGLQFPPNDES